VFQIQPCYTSKKPKRGTHKLTGRGGFKQVLKGEQRGGKEPKTTTIKNSDRGKMVPGLCGKSQKTSKMRGPVGGDP